MHIHQLIIRLIIILACAGGGMVHSTKHLFAQTSQAVSDSLKTAVVYEGRVIGDEKSLRIIMLLDQEATYSAFYMDKPRRLVVDLEKTRFSLADKNSLKARGIARDVRYGSMSGNRSRMVVTLAKPANITSFELEAVEDGQFQLTLDLQESDEKTFDQLLQSSSSKGERSNRVAIKGDKPGRVKAAPGRFIIVIDPGHGGIDGGASGKKGATEKVITLEFAVQLETLLKSSGPYDVYLTRRDDSFVSLRQRVDFTRNKRADLFISIHADSLKQRYVRGATIYTLSKKATDKLSKQLAQSENNVDLLAGLKREKISDAVIDILADLTMRETTVFSRRIANILVRRLSTDIRLIKNPHRSAAFGVLKDPEVPSILLELGYLSNKEDEELLLSDAWRLKVGAGIVDGVNSFFKGRKPRKREDPIAASNQ